MNAIIYTYNWNPYFKNPTEQKNFHDFFSNIFETTFAFSFAVVLYIPRGLV